MKKAAYIFCSAAVIILVIIASGIRLDIPVEKLKAKYADEHSKFLAIDGLTVHYRDEGKGFPLVLLHPSPSSLHTFDRLTGELVKKHYRVIRLDLPGYGLTGPSASGDYSLQAYMRFLDSFLTALKVDSCCLAGNSFGGRLAVEYAYARPERVKKLVLIAAAGYPLKEEGVLAVKMARTRLLRPIVRYATPRFFIAMNLRQAYGENQAVAAETVDRYYELMLRAGNRDTFIFMSNREPEDISVHVRQLHAPTLIVWGGRDSVIPPVYAEFFHRDIAGSRMIVYEGVGHLPQEAAPQRLADDIRAFLQGTGSRMYQGKQK